MQRRYGPKDALPDAAGLEAAVTERLVVAVEEVGVGEGDMPRHGNAEVHDLAGVADVLELLVTKVAPG